MEPELIMEKVAKASGANYNFHKESSKFQDSGPQAPVVSLLRGGLPHPSGLAAGQGQSLGPPRGGRGSPCCGSTDDFAQGWLRSRARCSVNQGKSRGWQQS